MASSSTTSFENNNNNQNSLNSFNNFTFSTHPFMSTTFSDLLASPAASSDDNNNSRGVPKFKSTPPPSLPLSPPPVSPSSYFAIPPGLSPAELLDSPVMLNSSNVSFFHIHHFCV